MKEFIIEQFAKIVTDVTDGNESPLKAYGILKSIQKELDLAIKEFEDYALQEAEKYDKTFSADGFTFERREGRRIWDFKECQS